MSNACGFKCFECGKEHGFAASQYVCPSCGGNLDVVYDYKQIASVLDKDRLAADPDLTIWRYRALLPIEDSSPVPRLTVGWTPIYDCRSLAERWGVGRLLLKDDGRNPTGSFKDRPSALAVVKAREAGASVITTASSGNAGSALAGMCANTGMKSVIFVPAGAPPSKLAQMEIYGASVVLVESNYDEAYDLCIKAALRFGWYQRSTGYNPFMAEGKKTGALEIAEQLNWDVPDKVVVAVGDGCIIGGLWKGFNDLYRLGFIDRLPQMVAVQSETASAIVDAANSDGIVRSGPAHTVADSICVGRPRDATRAIRAVRESGGLGVKVSDGEMIASVAQLACATGVFVEPAAAAPLAGLSKMCESGAITANQCVLLVLTGNGLKDVDAVRSGLKEPLRVPSDIELEELKSRLSTG
jgi:threonine synthase